MTAVLVIAFVIWVVVAVALSALVRSAAQIEEWEREPAPRAPHRPTWIAPDDEGAA